MDNFLWAGGVFFLEGTILTKRKVNEMFEEETVHFLGGCVLNKQVNKFWLTVMPRQTHSETCYKHLKL